jgi:hypothetical protein
MAAKKRLSPTGTDAALLPALPGPERPRAAETDEEPRDQFCYAFNDALPPDRDDRKCRNCKKYLTTICDQLEHFIDEDGDVDE